jgi:phosphoglycerate kinase
MQLPAVGRWGRLDGKRVLVRVDFNTPLVTRDGHTVVGDDFRLRAAVPLFLDLQSRGATVVACTHLGRPNGQVVDALRVAPLRVALARVCPGVELLENVRFDPGEESNDPDFGKRLIEGCDAYVNEAFSVSHRAHASVMAPPAHLPSAGGPLLLNEVSTLLSVFREPERPFIAVVGGAKVHDKLPLLERLAAEADMVLVGGAMAFTFWLAEGHEVGGSVVDTTMIARCRDLLISGRIVLPSDVRALAPSEPFGPAGGRVTPVVCEDGVPDGLVGLDIGPTTERTFARHIAHARTVFWNGPMGVFEDPRFMSGTTAVAKAVAACAGTTIVGGGDSAAALATCGLSSAVSFISTGGGASLRLLEDGDLPGLRALRESPWLATAP